MKPKFLSAYMDVAKRFAQLSSAKRLQVGAIIVKNDRIISIGYNGMPSGWDNVCENFVGYDNGGEERLNTKPEVLHAETNAIAKLARSNENGDGATMFLTHAPCMDCAKLVYQSGIKRLIYGETYRDDAGIRFLKASGVSVEHLSDEEQS